MDPTPGPTVAEIDRYIEEGRRLIARAEACRRTLIERDLVSIVGRDEGLGRPLLYGTTEGFLTYFGLNSPADLPRMDEIELFLAERESAHAEAQGQPSDDARTAEPDRAGPAGRSDAEVEVPSEAAADAAPDGTEDAEG